MQARTRLCSPVDQGTGGRTAGVVLCAGMLCEQAGGGMRVVPGGVGASPPQWRRRREELRRARHALHRAQAPHRRRCTSARGEPFG